QQAAAMTVRQLLAAYRDHEDLISIGAYRAGANPAVDTAIVMREEIHRYLRQTVQDGSSVESARHELLKLAQQCAAPRKSIPVTQAVPAAAGKPVVAR
ncbi:MAG: flagellum-specific ATP synthase FliI, partial [Pirellulaceae bacterium]